MLIVDNDPTALDLESLTFDDLPMLVRRAYDGREGIEMARRHLPDVTVLALMMPDVNGFDVVQALEGDPACAKISILVVTDGPVSDHARSRLSRSVRSIVEKSHFGRERLGAEIQRALPGRLGEL